MQTTASKVPKPPPPENQDHRIVLIWGALVLITLAIYWRVTGFDFVNFDDFTYVSQNPYVKQGVTLDALKWAFSAGYASNWHPLTWISHMLDCQIYGLNHPGGHHLTNLLFHIANTLLLFSLCRRLTGAVWRSALVAALFAWHPLHVESVAWVAERKDVLSTFFFLLTLLAYTRFVEASRRKNSGSKKWYTFTLVLFACGLMSKPMVVTLPFVLLLLDYWPLRRISFSDETDGHASLPKLFIEKIPFFLFCAAASLTTFLVQKSGSAVDLQMTIAQRIENATMGYGWYLRKILWPSGLAVFYPLPASIPPAAIAFSAIVLLAITILAVMQIKSRAWISVGWLWFLGMLVPVIGLVQVGAQATADRYAYLPLTGLFVIFAWGLEEILNHVPKLKNQLAGFVTVPLLAACIGLSWRQVAFWQNSETLFRRDLAVTTGNVMAHVNLGAALDEAGKPELAKAEFIAAARDTNSPNTLVSVGSHYARQGDSTNAIKYYQRAIQESPFYADAHYNLGNVLARDGQLEDAVREYRQALRIKPNTADAHNNLGAVLLRLGRYDEAMAEFKTALRLQPDFPAAEDQLGHVLVKLDRGAEALPHFQTAAALSPTLVDAHLQAGLLLAGDGKILAALVPIQKVIQLDPGNVQAHFTLGAIYQVLQQYDQAAENFEVVLRLNPRHLEAAERLGAMLARQGKFSEAITAYRRALILNPDAVNALQGLAWILATSTNAELRNGAEAVRLAQHAAELTGRKQPLILTALDAALAENGRFDEAIKTAQETTRLARSLKQDAIADQAQARIELYQQGKPFHQ